MGSHDWTRANPVNEIKLSDPISLLLSLSLSPARLLLSGRLKPPHCFCKYSLSLSPSSITPILNPPIFDIWNHHQAFSLSISICYDFCDSLPLRNHFTSWAHLEPSDHRFIVAFCSYTAQPTSHLPKLSGLDLLVIHD